jgi:hypothetical protein
VPDGLTIPLSAAVMPEGVEHTLSEYAGRWLSQRVPTAVMPEGTSRAPTFRAEAHRGILGRTWHPRVFRPLRRAELAGDGRARGEESDAVSRR